MRGGGGGVEGRERAVFEIKSWQFYFKSLGSLYSSTQEGVFFLHS